MSEWTCVVCPSCGIEVRLRTTYVTVRKNDHQLFYCPNGHGQRFPAPPDVFETSLGETEHACAAEESTLP